MRKFVLLCLAMSFALFAGAQKFAKIPENLKNLSAQKSLRASVDIPMNLTTGSIPMVYPHQGKSTNEIEIGQTQYDLQTNQSVQNRIYLFPDSTIGATFTYGTTPPNYNERGTGYNYFDNTAWGPNCTARVESARCGWPSYMPLPGGGEMVLSHNGNNGLLVTSRPVKGTGAWTTSTLVGPVTTGGTTALLWPRAIAVDSTIHLIACTDQATAPAVWYYQGLALALVYYKSTDAGATWSGPTILPGMDSASIVTPWNNTGFGGDSYAWAAPKGDTIAFAVGDNWGGLFAMKSFDAGTTWTKVMVYDFPDVPVATGIPIASVDGSVACAIDNSGKVHVVSGKMRVSDDDYSDDQSSYYPYTDGVIYWNENMPPLDSGLLNNDSLLFLAGNYIAGMIDYDLDGAITFPSVGTGQWPFGNYYLSLSSMPQILIDGDTIYVTYSSCREDLTNPGANPNEQLYRHLYIMKCDSLGYYWGNPADITDNAIHQWDECVFGSMSFTSDNRLHIVYQGDEEPGLAVRGDEDGNTTNRIYYISVTKNDFSIGKCENQAKKVDALVYPNPAIDHTHVNLNLNSSDNVQVNIVNLVGQTIFSKNYGKLNMGQNNLTINTSNFNDGIYFVNIQAGSTRISQKLIVQ